MNSTCAHSASGVATTWRPSAVGAMLNWTDVLRMTNRELRARGVPARRVTDLRMELTGHQRSMEDPWWMSIGLWGGVYSAAQIAEILGLPVTRVHAYARGSGLRTTLKYPGLDAKLLAALAYDRASDADFCRVFGILEVERRRYIAAAEAIVGVGRTLEGVTSEDWCSAWAEFGQAPMPIGLPDAVRERRSSIDKAREAKLIRDASRQRRASRLYAHH